MADDNIKQDYLDDNAPQKKAKAIALLSGGLDSNLAVRLMLEQGVEVEAVAVKTPFCDFDCGKGCGHRVKEVADDLSVPLKTLYFGQEYLRMLKHPKFGFGSGMNPCLDCRSMMYNAAKQYMETVGADFIVTGEVLFQRPMSQNFNALEIIEKETGTEGKVLRPLSAKCLPLTDVEKSGCIKRENLCNITGRSRKVQLALAKRFGIADPPNSAGGCLLTDPQFSRRISDLMEHIPDPLGVPTLNDVELLKVGRHFRLSSTVKLIVGRNEIENEIIWSLRLKDDLGMQVKEYPGPSSVLRGCGYAHPLVHMAAQIVLRYSDCPREKESSVEITFNGQVSDILVVPFGDDELEALRI
jgi:tRNA U34 2-thiouridine synthase MnmA/TrmU